MFSQPVLRLLKNVCKKFTPPICKFIALVGLFSNISLNHWVSNRYTTTAGEGGRGVIVLKEENNLDKSCRNVKVNNNKLIKIS